MSHDIKYIGMDVHKEATVIAVLSGSGKLVMESIVETKASSILQFIHGLRGELHVTWEEGTWAAWLYDLLQPQVTRVLVCDPRRNALLKEGSKSDKIDARKLADLLRTGMLRPVYHGEHGLRTLRELGRSYQTISQDLNRVMNRIKLLHLRHVRPAQQRAGASPTTATAGPPARSRCPLSTSIDSVSCDETPRVAYAGGGRMLLQRRWRRTTRQLRSSPCATSRPVGRSDGLLGLNQVSPPCADSAAASASIAQLQRLKIGGRHAADHGRCDRFFVVAAGDELGAPEVHHTRYLPRKSSS